MDYRQTYDFWKQRLAGTPYSCELAAMEGDEAGKEDAFYRCLEFGTAGMRGVLGMGTNRMNIFTVRRAAFGLALHVGAIGGANDGVAIAYDSRNMSDEFALETALTLCAAGIRTYLFPQLTSVPLLSFAVQQLACAAGVVITASHNPAKYNGFKVYGSNGGQLAGSDADSLVRCVDGIGDVFAIETMPEDAARRSGLLTDVPADINEAYYRRVEALVMDRASMAAQADKLNIVYTPLNGTGNVPVCRVLSDLGINRLHIVPEQQLPDGNFPTVSAPNPEAPEAFTLAEKLADGVGADLIIATDPDCDRMGAAVRSGEGWRVLTGNEIGCLLMDYILAQKQPAFTGDEFVVRSIVSTPMADAVAAHYGVEMRSVLTGFKYIAEQMAESSLTGRGTFLFGFEESYGFIVGDFVRDKDACIASALLADAACHYAGRGLTIAQAVTSLYERYGYFTQEVFSLTREGIEGLAAIRRTVAALRSSQPKSVAGFAVLALRDYYTQLRITADGIVERLTLPQSDVLYFELECGSLIIRPSGTEPKLKAYISVSSPDREQSKELANQLKNGAYDMITELLNA